MEMIDNRWMIDGGAEGRAGRSGKGRVGEGGRDRGDRWMTNHV